MQVSWNSPVTSSLLLDAGFGGVYYGWGSFERDPNPTRGLTRIVEQCAAGCAANGGIANLTYRSQNFNVNNTGSFSWKAQRVARHGQPQHQGRLSGHVDGRQPRGG